MLENSSSSVQIFDDKNYAPMINLNEQLHDNISIEKKSSSVSLQPTIKKNTYAAASQQLIQPIGIDTSNQLFTTLDPQSVHLISPRQQ